MPALATEAHTPMTDTTTPHNPAQPLLQALPEQLPDGAQLVMRVMPMPADANANGDIFGGWIMAQVDIAGAVLPARISRGRVATVAVNEFVFKQAVSVGDLLSFYSRVTRIGNTSVSVHVEVYAERNPANPQVVRVTDAKLTYVAIDREGRSRPIPNEAKEAADALKTKDPEDARD
jgi:acyl-CoA thioesterase YciA